MRVRMFGLVAVAGLAFGQTSLDRAEALYHKTQYKQALAALQSAGSSDADVLTLRGKIYFRLQDYSKATDALNAAVKMAPNSSDTWMWLGRAYGRRAETSSFLTAPKYASDCRKAFEKAVELDSHNVEAMSDLMEFYLEAPGILGGGMDKAEAMAKRIGALDPVEKYYADARIAEKREDYATAEKDLRKAAELAPKDPARLLDVATFLARRGRTQESEEVFRQAEQLAPNSPQVLFEHAQFYVKGKRNLNAARQMLERYLDADLTPDDPPRQDAEDLLRQASGN